MERKYKKEAEELIPCVQGVQKKKKKGGVPSSSPTPHIHNSRREKEPGGESS
jgi:hypothetical protein